jgi:hypothetical protein
MSNLMNLLGLDEYTPELWLIVSGIALATALTIWSLHR